MSAVKIWSIICITTGLTLIIIGNIKPETVKPPAETIGSCDRCLHPFVAGDHVQSSEIAKRNNVENVSGVIIDIDSRNIANICNGTNHHYIAVHWLERVVDTPPSSTEHKQTKGERI